MSNEQFSIPASVRSKRQLRQPYENIRRCVLKCLLSHGYKFCHECRFVKCAADDFSPTARYCRPCVAIRSRASYARNPNKRAYCKSWVDRQRESGYQTWRQIINRCHNPKHPAYKWYGGRGISVWPAWRDDHAAFSAYIGQRPSSAHSLDRFPDNDGNYEPGNLRWATWDEQARNKRGVNLTTYRGETLCQKDWAERVGISAGVLAYRLKKSSIAAILDAALDNPPFDSPEVSD